MPTIAAIQGACVGGAIDMVCMLHNTSSESLKIACRYRFAEDLSRIHL